MNNHRLIANALTELAGNKEQLLAANIKSHCVVLAGPGSGKTKTLTTAMARTLQQDVAEPRGVACITYSNECAYELEERLAGLGIERGDRAFIGTVHSFALTQIILPYGRCVLPPWAKELKVASDEERRDAIAAAHAETIGGNDDPQKRWGFATEKRKNNIDRANQAWRGSNPELADFIESYERHLRKIGKIDFDDMPLIAYDMLSKHPWICAALRAKFPVIFVDEYQDLGHALHRIVLKLCFESNVRLFAVGDADQSIYGFNGAEPSLLMSLLDRADVTPINLKFNYRCGTDIISASLAALGEHRGYVGPEGAEQGQIDFHPVVGADDDQAKYVLEKLVPELVNRGFPLNEIGILYRWAKHSDAIVAAAEAVGMPFIRADKMALVKRGSSVGRFAEKCARWIIGGWKTAEPRFHNLCRDALRMVYGGKAGETERRQIERDLIAFLQPQDGQQSVHQWLQHFRRDLIIPWRAKASTLSEPWEDLDEMIRRTDPSKQGVFDRTIAHFAGDTAGTGAINLSTFHSSKGREFGAVILLGISRGVIPTSWSENNAKKLKEDRREFYVAVTRAKKELHVVYREGLHSPFVAELYNRAKS